VGEALARYLRQGRPRCSSRRVFMRMKAPRQGFTGSAAINNVVRRALGRAGLILTRTVWPPGCSAGVHRLRRSARS
jgi:hypothetical protein